MSRRDKHGLSLWQSITSYKLFSVKWIRVPAFTWSLRATRNGEDPGNTRSVSVPYFRILRNNGTIPLNLLTSRYVGWWKHIYSWELRWSGWLAVRRFSLATGVRGMNDYGLVRTREVSQVVTRPNQCTCTWYWFGLRGYGKSNGLYALSSISRWWMICDPGH